MKLGIKQAKAKQKMKEIKWFFPNHTYRVTSYKNYSRTTYTKFIRNPGVHMFSINMWKSFCIRFRLKITKGLQNCR